MVEKQKAGFRFGKYKLTVLDNIGACEHNGRSYCFVRVRTSDGIEYFSLRLYNRNGKFIKQFLFEPEILKNLIEILSYADSKKEEGR